MPTMGLRGADPSTRSADACRQQGSESNSSLWSSRLPTRLRGSRGILLGVAALAIGGAALGWPWLVAIGLAPILLSIAPCAVMCALGLCMMRRSVNPAALPGVQTDASGATVAPIERTGAPLSNRGR